MDEQDVIVFLEMIQDQGCKILEDHTDDGFRTLRVLSRNGKTKVLIDASEETIHIATAIEYLFQLELGDLVAALYLNATF